MIPKISVVGQVPPRFSSQTPSDDDKLKAERENAKDLYESYL